MSVSPMAVSLGLGSSGECWLLAYNDMAWRTHLFLILFSLVGMFPTLWGIASLSLLSTVYPLWLLYLLACQCPSPSCPQLKYLKIMQMIS